MLPGIVLDRTPVLGTYLGRLMQAVASPLNGGGQGVGRPSWLDVHPPSK